VTHKCGETCSDCRSVHPCTFSEERVPCESCKRNYRSRSCFEKHKTNKLGSKTVCEKVRNCAVCNVYMSRKNHECFKPFCANCNENMEINHLFYMQPLKNEVPSVDNVLFVFFDFETSQDTKISETAKLHVPILVCLQQFCTACEMQDKDDERDCARCGKRRYSFFEDPVGDLLSYLYKPRPWCKKVVAIAHNAKAFDSQFILNRAILLKWTPEFILNGLKIVSMNIHHIQVLDSVSYMPMPLRKLPEAFGFTSSKSWYPHYFNTKADYVGHIPDIEYYGADEMSEGERREFMAWYKKQEVKVFDNRSMLEQYCQDDVTVLRQACRVFRREFLEIGNIEVFSRY